MPPPSDDSGDVPRWDRYQDLRCSLYLSTVPFLVDPLFPFPGRAGSPPHPFPRERHRSEPRRERRGNAPSPVKRTTARVDTVSARRGGLGQEALEHRYVTTGNHHPSCCSRSTPRTTGLIKVGGACYLIMSALAECSWGGALHRCRGKCAGGSSLGSVAKRSLQLLSHARFRDARTG